MKMTTMQNIIWVNVMRNGIFTHL